MKSYILATIAAGSLLFGVVANVFKKEESPMPWVLTNKMTRIHSSPILDIMAVNVEYHMDLPQEVVEPTTLYPVLDAAVREYRAAYPGNIFDGDRRPLENYLDNCLKADLSLARQGYVITKAYIVN